MRSLVDNLLEMLFIIGAFLALLLLLLAAFAALDYVKATFRNLVLQGKPQATRTRVRDPKTTLKARRSKIL